MFGHNLHKNQEHLQSPHLYLTAHSYLAEIPDDMGDLRHTPTLLLLVHCGLRQNFKSCALRNENGDEKSCSILVITDYECGDK